MKAHVLSIIAAATITLSVLAWPFDTLMARILPSPPHAPYDPAPDADRCPVDLVICLDTSGSMTALLDSARGRLWDVVNDLAKARPTPSLRVGLLTYGSPSRARAAEGWVVRQIDLTSDLDSVYGRMMAMTTEGGEEYVGWVLNEALKTMSWSSDPRALKLIFVAGNESADQGAEHFNFRYVSEQARSRGITINAIYAGNRPQGIQEKWQEVAKHGGGSFSAIDMHCGTIQISTPQDSILLQLNLELNATYIPYGERGEAGAANQAEQDRNAEAMGPQAASSRALAKGGRLYSNAVWDLVDAAQGKDFDWASLESEDLPANMRSMSVSERQAYVEAKRVARAEIQKKIQEVSGAREAFLKQARQKAGGGATSLDDAMLQTIHEQAKAKGFTFSSGN